jgi:hypothetical protein
MDAEADWLALLDLLLSPQPARAVATMAAPPTAITNPRFTSVLLLVVVIRQDRRPSPSSMVFVVIAVMRLPEITARLHDRP